MKLSRISAILALVLVLILSSCTAEEQKTKYSAYSMDYFDTVITVTGYEYSKDDFDRISGEMLDMLGEYHRLYTIYHRFDGMENLCTINELVEGEHRTVTVDPRIIDMLLYAVDMYERTDGIMNIAMGSVLSVWHDYRTVGKDDPEIASLPPMEILEKAAEHTDITKMIIDKEACTVTLTDPEMKLDVGAIAKGYATQRVAESFEERGVTGYILNVGGNVRTLGPKADGNGWYVGIEDPGGDDYLAYLDLNGQSVVTSGSYQRFYYVDGKPYHHIIHPDTLMPSVGYLSVSVVCEHSGMADALSTALFCLPYEDGKELIESIPQTEAMWVTEEGEKLFSSGWCNYEKK